MVWKTLCSGTFSQGPKRCCHLRILRTCNRRQGLDGRMEGFSQQNPLLGCPQKFTKWLGLMGYNPNIPHLSAHLEVGEITHLLTIDPNFLGHPSGVVTEVLWGFGLSYTWRIRPHDLDTCFSLTMVSILESPNWGNFPFPIGPTSWRKKEAGDPKHLQVMRWSSK